MSLTHQMDWAGGREGKEDDHTPSDEEVGDRAHPAPLGVADHHHTEDLEREGR